MEPLVARDAAVHPFGLLLAGDNLDAQSGSAPDGRDQIVRILRIAGRARGQHADGRGILVAGVSDEFGDRAGCSLDGDRLEDLGVVKTGSEAGLFGSFVDGLDETVANVAHQQLDAVGANVDDGAASAAHARKLNQPVGGRQTATVDTE